MTEARPALLDAIDPHAHAVIEASAGTGKTFTIEHLVIELVRRGASIDRVLVVTFTEKATREMRVRIRDRLALASGESNALRTALASFDRAPISTIHGFCQRLLTEHAFASGRAFEPEHVDGRAAFGRALRRVMRGAEGEVLAVLSAALGVTALTTIEEGLFAFHRESCVVLPDANAARARAALLEVPDVEDVEPWLTSIEHPRARSRPRAELPALVTLARRARTEPIERVLAPLLEWAMVSEGPKSARERTIVVLARALAAHPVLGPALAALSEVVLSPWPLLVHEVLPAVRAELEREKRELGLVDYDDLLSLVLEALRGPRGPELVRSVRARHAHALVDEFQDTDDRQWEIFRRLFVDPCEGAPSTSLAVIGDPKQAIYGFRGADVHTYDRACTALERDAGARRFVLDRSFRTSAALLGAVHAIVRPPDEPSFFTGVVRYDAPVEAARTLRLVGDAGEDLAPMRIVHLVSDGELRMKPTRRALARFYASEIERLIGGGARVVDEHGEHAIEASDVFVLTRSASEGDEVGDALRARGIPYAFFRKDGLFATDEAKDVLDVLRALSSPRDRRARARAYASAIFAVPIERLADATELPGDHPVPRVFDQLLALAQARDVAPLLRAVVDETGLARRELYLHASERRLTNYLHLTEVLLAMAHRGGLSLRDLTARLGELVSGRARPAEDEDIQRLPSERAAVQILTIHKAKGLEGRVVFLFGGFGQRSPAGEAPIVLHGPASGTPDGRYAWAGPMSADAKARFEREDAEEAQRLYYVALTRAASMLYLPYVGARPAETDASPLKLRGPYRVVNAQLARCVQRGLDPALAVRTELDVREEVRAPRPSAPTATRTETPRALPHLSTSTVATLRSALAGVEVTSYSRMKARARGERGRGHDVLIEDVNVERDEGRGEATDRARGDASELPGGADAGVMVHEILETMPIDRVRVSSSEELAADPELLELARAAADRNGIAQAFAPAALGLAIRGLKTPLPSLALAHDLAEPTRRVPEMPFVHPIPEAPGVAIERGFVRGVIDLLFEHEGKLYVLDWKTDRLEAYDTASMQVHVRASYEVQVRLYTLACARAFTLGSEAEYEARFGGVLYVFLRGLAGEQGALFLRPRWEEVQRWEDDMRHSDAPWGYPLPERRSVRHLASRIEPLVSEKGAS